MSERMPGPAGNEGEHTNRQLIQSLQKQIPHPEEIMAEHAKTLEAMEQEFTAQSRPDSELDALQDPEVLPPEEQKQFAAIVKSRVFDVLDTDPQTTGDDQDTYSFRLLELRRDKDEGRFENLGDAEHIRIGWSREKDASGKFGDVDIEILNDSLVGQRVQYVVSKDEVHVTVSMLDDNSHPIVGSQSFSKIRVEGAAALLDLLGQIEATSRRS